jgi:carboxyl-terminal processing protease
MSGESRSRKPGRAVLAFVVGAGLGISWTLAYQRMGADPEIDLVRSVRDLVVESFVESVRTDNLTDAALRGMVDDLDRHSRFFASGELARLDRETSGEFEGIGVVFRPPSSEGQILFPFPGSPAARAGLRVGDRVLSLDGIGIEYLPEGGLQHAIQLHSGSEVVLRLRALDGTEREARVAPERMVDPSVRHVRLVDAEHAIGYLALLSFSYRSPQDLDRAVSDLMQQGARALVLDLRGNPGGVLDAAVTLANRFIARGPIVHTRTRSTTLTSEAAPSEARLVGTPLVVLIDGGSASASEVLAGALQDHAACVLVGEPTYGKGTVQTLTRFGEDRAVVKITTAHYFTPSGRAIERHAEDPDRTGIAPDVFVPVSADQREALRAWLDSYAPPPEVMPEVRAWESRQGIVLVPQSPPDPQLDAALGLLRGEPPAPHFTDAR